MTSTDVSIRPSKTELKIVVCSIRQGQLEGEKVGCGVAPNPGRSSWLHHITSGPMPAMTCHAMTCHADAVNIARNSGHDWFQPQCFSLSDDEALSLCGLATLRYASLYLAVGAENHGTPWHGAKVSTEEAELTHAAQRLRKARAQGFNMFQQRRTLFNICHLHAKPGQADHSDISLKILSCRYLGCLGVSGIVEPFCLLREAFPNSLGLRVSTQIKVRCGNPCLLWGFQRFRDTGSIGSGVHCARWFQRSWWFPVFRTCWCGGCGAFPGSTGGREATGRGNSGPEAGIGGIGSYSQPSGHIV